MRGHPRKKSSSSGSDSRHHATAVPQNNNMDAGQSSTRKSATKNDDWDEKMNMDKPGHKKNKDEKKARDVQDHSW